MRYVPVAVVCLLTFAHHFGLPKTHATDDPLPEIRESLSRYYSTIRSLTVTLDQIYEGDPSKETKTQTKWAIDRNRKMCATWSVPLDAALPASVRRFASECDGVAYQISDFWPDSDRLPEQIIKRIGQPILRNTLTSAPSYRAAGLAVGPANDRLDLLLMRPEVVVEAQEDHGGALCWRLNLGKADFSDLGLPDINPHEIIVWLDPAVGFLLRRASVIPSRLAAIRDNPEALREFQPQEGDLPGTIIVKDFQKVEDPILGSRWFPHELDFGPGDYVRFYITEVKFNRRIPRDEFIPVPAFGTRILELHQDGTQNTQFSGGDEGQDEFLRLVAKHYSSAPTENASPATFTPSLIATANNARPIDASVDTSWSLRDWSALAAAMFAVTAFTCRTVARRPTSFLNVILTRRNR